MTEIVMLVPDTESLTVPIAAATELSKLYIQAAAKVSQLARQTQVVEADGHTVVIDHPDLKWWFDQCRRIATDIAKVTTTAEMTHVDQKLHFIDIILNSPSIPQDIREQIQRSLVQKKV